MSQVCARHAGVSQRNRRKATRNRRKATRCRVAALIAPEHTITRGRLFPGDPAQDIRDRERAAEVHSVTGPNAEAVEAVEQIRPAEGPTADGIGPADLSHRRPQRPIAGNSRGDGGLVDSQQGLQ
jgi:hypothetical protein